MEDIKIEIKAPLYRGFLLVLISGLFWFTLFSVVLVIMAIVSQSGGLFGMVVGGYMLMLISFIALKIYQKASKCRIVIDGIEVAKYRGSKKVKSIAIEDIEGMNFEKYDFPHASFDAVTIYTQNLKDRIRFYAPSTIVFDIEKVTNKAFNEGKK